MADEKYAARQHDRQDCPKVEPPAHVGGPIEGPCAKTVKIEGQLAARQLDLALCEGDGMTTIIKGSPTVRIEGQRAARVGDKTDHGGRIARGATTVIIGDVGKRAEV